MSNRALRKLQGDSDITIPPRNGEDLEGEESDSAVRPGSNIFKSRKLVPSNPFDLLNDDDGEDDEVNISTNSDIGGETENKSATSPETVSQTQPKKKKKKRKKKGKSVPSETDTSSKLHGEEDEIDAGLREVNRLLGDIGVQSQEGGDNSIEGPITSNMRSLLTVEHKNLNPENEMRRIFGSRVVQSEQIIRRRTRNRHAHRSSWLATPKDTWPAMGKTGLSMNHLESRHGNQYFCFEHNHQYQQIQVQFWEAVDSLNHQNIVNILQLQHYHIDSLLQLSEVCRMSEDIQMSTELVERALYCFEAAFHPLFSLTQGTCRLNYKQSENRAYFIALFRHLNFVAQKGCYRTALEFCKLLLSLDPEDDPLCVLLMIDFFALKSQQFSFLIRMSEEWESHRNLSQLPNFALSVPLAMYQLAVQSGQDTSKAGEMLADSLLMFPSVLLPLLEKCGVNPDSSVTKSAFLGPTSQYCESSSLKQLVALYVGRNWPCWKEPEVMAWLEQTVRRVLELVDAKDSRVEEYNDRRKTRYRGTPRNIYRHILISEVKEATATLPMDVASGVVSHDPLPPLDSTMSYERPARRTQAQEDGNYLSMFLRSLLPNFNPDEVIQEAEGAAGGAQGNELRQGVGALMDAMRDLLNNIRPVDPPVENQHNADREPDNDEGNQEWD